jgi:hypothetical protein
MNQLTDERKSYRIEDKNTHMGTILEQPRSDNPIANLDLKGMIIPWER